MEKVKRKTILELSEARDLVYGEKVKGIIIGDKTFDGVVVGLGSSGGGFMKNYIIECTDGTFPNEIYPFKCLSLPLSEIIF